MKKNAYKSIFDDKSQEIGVSMFQASNNKVYSLKEENENIINSGDFNPDSIFGSNINNTQNISKKELKSEKSQAKDLNQDMKRDLSELSFSILENDDVKNEVNFLKV